MRREGVRREGGSEEGGREGGSEEEGEESRGWTGAILLSFRSSRVSRAGRRG